MPSNKERKEKKSHKDEGETKKHKEKKEKREDKEKSVKDRKERRDDEHRHKHKENKERKHKERRREDDDKEEIDRDLRMKRREERRKRHEGKDRSHENGERRHDDTNRRHENKERKYKKDEIRRQRHKDEDGEKKSKKHHKERKDKESTHKEKKNKDYERQAPFTSKPHVRPKVTSAYDYEDDFEDYEGHEDGKRLKSKKSKKTSRTSKGKEQDDSDNAYDDDFDDYEDDDDKESNDSESDSESSDSSDDESEDDTGDQRMEPPNEVLQVVRALNEENQQLSKDKDFKQQRSERTRQKKIDDTSSFINFSSAKQQHISAKAASSVRQRFSELCNLVELDVSAFSLLELAPVSEYELYIRSFGHSNSQQTSTQTNNDDVERENQTEEIETVDCWTQFPSDGLKSVGNPGVNDEDEEVFKKINLVTLNQFVERASQVMLNILEEECVRDSECKSHKSKIAVSKSFSTLQTSSLFQDYFVSYAEFADQQSHLVLALHRHQTSDFERGFISVWSSLQPSQPQKVLAAESTISCASFSPNAEIVVAGSSDGSVLLWDLREPVHFHQILSDHLVLRYPTYSTAGVLMEGNHQSSVCSIKHIESWQSDAAQSNAATFQLVSLDEMGHLNLWTVSQLRHGDPAGSEADYGLAPNGRVHLQLSDSLESPTTDQPCVQLVTRPTKPSQFFVCTATGVIHQLLRSGMKASPSQFSPDFESLVKITCVDFSVFTEQLFLVGGSDGSLQLFSALRHHPLLYWNDSTNGAAITHVTWSRSRPSVFFVVSADRRLHIWDLLLNDNDSIKVDDVSNDPITALNVANDHDSLGYGTAGQYPQMVIAFEDGRIEVHRISKQFCTLLTEEVDQFSDWVTQRM